MLRMKYLWTLALVALLMAMTSSMAFAQWLQIEYNTPLAPTSVPVPTVDSEATFSEDVDTDFWAWAQVEECAATATPNPDSDYVVLGMAEGYYGPTFTVTRGSMAAFIARAANLTLDAPDTATFLDVPTDYWSFADVERCVDGDIVQGYADGNYRPTLVVDRAQMCVYIGRAASVTTGVVGSDPFGDVAADHWAAEYIQACVDEYIVQGYSAAVFAPDNAVTRAQMAVFIWRGLVRGIDDTHVVGADVVCGLGATDDSSINPGAGDNAIALYYADDHSLTDAAEIDVDSGVVVYVALDGAQHGDGSVTFEVLDSEENSEGTANVSIDGSDGRDAVDTASGAHPYTIVSYRVPDVSATADDYTVTVELPNGAVLTVGEFTVE